MDHKRLKSALEKTGAEIASVKGRENSWYAKKGNRSVCWYDQEGSAVAVHTPSPYTDSYSDCNCDTFHRTIKSAVASIERGE